jgi:hypothetical protein
MGPDVVTRYINGHRCGANARLYDTIFTDNNLTMTIYYASVDGGTWYASNSVSWEAVNGTAIQEIYCANAHAGFLRWRVDWQATGGDSKTYVDYSCLTAFAAYDADRVTSPRHSLGKKLYELASWNFSSSFPNLNTVAGNLLTTVRVIIAA